MNFVATLWDERSNVSMEFGEKVRNRIAELGLTQELIGERLGVAQTQVSRWINKNTPPQKWRMLLNLARSLQVTVDYLIDDSIEVVTELPSSDLTADEKISIHFLRAIKMKSTDLIWHFAEAHGWHVAADGEVDVMSADELDQLKKTPTADAPSPKKKPRKLV